MAVCVKYSLLSLPTPLIFWYKAQPFFKVVVFPLICFGKHYLKNLGN